MNMPFGRYKGQRIEDIPEDYLIWCLENCKMTSALTDEMENQLKLKKGEGVIREKDKL